ncbi:MAG: histidine kinase [Bacteroidales bacterium]|nr:histidine kinase [Bacteroidales bacterium]
MVDKDFINLVILLQIIITVAITTIHTSVGLYIAWKQVSLNEEKLKKEAVALQLDTLRNQVNPHFLFNSLNTLTSLVETNARLAVKYIKKLSEVYRYVLDSKDKELVALHVELDFINAYMYLQSIRFSESLDYNVEVKDKEAMIIPCALQMLMENAIKHNVISTAKPLKIEIRQVDNYLVVKNSLQKKLSVKNSSKIGLANLKTRYDILSQLKFSFKEDIVNQEFKVCIPLIYQL